MTRRSRTEDEWFARHEQDLISQLRRERVRREKQLAEYLQQEEAGRQKELHWMKCPRCGSQLAEEPVIPEVLIERCTLCGGLYFDRGELEDILLNSAEERRIFWLGILHLIFPSWGKKLPDSEKMLSEYHAERDRRQKLVQQYAGSENGKKEMELHSMKCSKCGSAMETVDLAGLHVDLCSVCWGLFLEFGELESIRSRSEKERREFRMKLLTLPLQGKE